MKQIKINRKEMKIYKQKLNEFNSFFDEELGTIKAQKHIKELHEQAQKAVKLIGNEPIKIEKLCNTLNLDKSIMNTIEYSTYTRNYTGFRKNEFEDDCEHYISLIDGALWYDDMDLPYVKGGDNNVPYDKDNIILDLIWFQYFILEI